ncbi:MAG: CU044_5270 family protein [Actinomycetota bacterium]
MRTDLEWITGFRRELSRVPNEVAEQAWTEFNRRLNTTTENGRPVLPGAPRWGSRRLRLLAGMTLAALALLASFVLPAGSGGAEPAAADAARRVARVAQARRAEPAPRPGQYLYESWDDRQSMLFVPKSGLQSFTFMERMTIERWVGVDGSGLSIASAAQAEFPTSADRQAWVAAGSPDLGIGDGQDRTRYGPEELWYPDVASLPTDPETLLEVLEQRQVIGGPDGDWETFNIVEELLHGSYSSPDLRAGLFEVVANLSGVEFVGRIHDGLRRPGIAVAYTHAGVRRELIFDPRTSELLGRNQVIVDPSEVGLDLDAEPVPGIYGLAGEAGSIAYSATYRVRGIAESMGTRPASAR